MLKSPLERIESRQLTVCVPRRVADALNHVDLSVRGARALALGVTCKPDVGDILESAALHVLAQLHRKGAILTFHDLFVRTVEYEGVRLERTALTDEAVQRADCVLLLDARNAVGRSAGTTVVTL